MPSERARRLVEALHEPHSLETRWDIADQYLAEEREDCAGVRIPRMTDTAEEWRKFYQRGSVLISERIAQDRGHNGEDGGGGAG